MDRNAPPFLETSSSAANLVDVATHGSWKTILLGMVWLLPGCGALAILAAALSTIHWERSQDVSRIGATVIPITAAFGLVAWWLLATAVRRFRAAFEPDCYLRASPVGLSFRVPGGVTLSSLLFGYAIKERHLRWDEVKSWYPYLSTINGIPSKSAIVVETVRGGKITIPTMYFSESRRRIGDKIIQAMSKDKA